MKGSLVRDGVCVLLGSVLTLAVVFSVRGALQDAVAQGGGGDVPVGNGDVNADGEIDLSDAVYILESLFMGGPDIVPIECQDQECQDNLASCQSDLATADETITTLTAQVSQLESELQLCRAKTGLPATGQAKCYDNLGNEIACDSTVYPGQDGAHEAGCPTEGRFVDNGDGTVTDTCTGLMWQKDTADVSRNGSVGFEDLRNWQEALQYCENLSFAGHSDWRLPNVGEFQSIVDFGRQGPALHSAFKASGAFEYCWSSTSYSSLPEFAWFLDLGAGNAFFDDKDIRGYHVRAVRSER